VLAVETTFNGLGAQTLRLVDTLAVADAVGGRLVVHRSKYWNYGCAPHAGWNCYFHPPASPHSPIVPNIFVSLVDYSSSDDEAEIMTTHASPVLLPRKSRQVRRENCAELSHLASISMLTPGSCVKVSTPESALLAAATVEKLSAPDRLALARNLAGRIWRLKAPTRARIDDLLAESGLEPGMSYVGVHVRRGDKDKEVAFVALTEYIRAVDAVAPASDTPVFVASDDSSVASALAILAPGRAIFTLSPAASPAIRGGHDQLAHNRGALKHNRARVEALLAEIHALVHADLFVGSFSSNLGRLVHVLRSADAETSISVDDRWAPGVAFRTFGIPYCDAVDANARYCEVLRHSNADANV
jgi:hypothetical protein